MEEEKEINIDREIPKIEISYLNGVELSELKSKRKFVEYILENSLSGIDEAIRKKWDKGRI